MASIPQTLHVPGSFLKDQNAIKKVTPHIVPCKIQYNGPADMQRFFHVYPHKASTAKSEPTAKESALKESYFRGRQLIGHTLHLPQGYKGFVFSDPPRAGTDKIAYSDFEDEGDQDVEQIWTPQAEFSEMLIWDHDVPPDAISDPWISSVQEWTQLAKIMHAEDA
ncbi:ribonuclease H2, subunit C [Lipomyces arxii]|uniref:ribonuclease H2, subunit C n=1 Tax=Lipomyces arxii TaxID=56418 RepID=UPI0034CEDE06